MKKIMIASGLALLTLLSCDFSKSVNVNLVSGLRTTGDGLSCENVYISDGEQEITRSTFTYGETFTVYFDDIEGFTKSDAAVFPGMRVTVVGEDGETALSYDDLYADYTDGVDFSPLVLSTAIVTAKPMSSKGKYTLKVDIWDKKGDGKFKAELDFDIVANEHIKTKATGVTYDEIYLFSKERSSTITSNSAYYNENIYVIFEGLDGFSDVGGEVLAGLSIIATDADGEVVINEEDLFGAAGMEISSFHSQLAPSIIFSNQDIKSPVKCEFLIWDKQSDNRIESIVELKLLSN